MIKYIVFAIEWVKYSRTKTQQHYGFTIHLTQEDVNIYIENHWLKLENNDDDEFIAPIDMTGIPINIDLYLYQKLLKYNDKNIYGVWVNNDNMIEQINNKKYNN